MLSHPSMPNLSLRLAREAQGWTQEALAEHLGTNAFTVSRWERGEARPSPYFRQKLVALLGKSEAELGLLKGFPARADPPHPEGMGVLLPRAAPPEVPALWTVPYPRNPHFTGREELLDHLEQHLSSQEVGERPTTRSAALTQAQAIKGLGGIGKTQIALEYVYRARAQGRYQHTLWINAASEETLITSLTALADLLPDLPTSNETDQRKLVAAIKGWLEQCQDRWLVILDNADDLALLQGYLPHQGQGSILLTTRATAVGALAVPLEVDTMGVREGTQFLLQRAQRLAASADEVDEATNVVIALDGFPLALDQAGAYIEETGCSFGDYLQTYQQHRQALLARRGLQATGYPESVATTWSLSFEKIEQTMPAAVELLRLCAFLAPDHIPEELLTAGAAYWPPRLQQAVADRLSFNQLLEHLLRFSLVKRLVDEQRLSIHRLVQAVQVDQLDQDQQRCWAERVVRAVAQVFPREPKEVASWPGCLRYLEQAQACATLIQQHRLWLPEAGDLLDRTGTYLREHAAYPLAETLYQQALTIREQVLGPEHPDVAESLHNLAVLTFRQGRYAQAVPPCQRALAIWEQALGPEHPDVAFCLHTLAACYEIAGQYAEALPRYERALAIRERALGPEHPDVANTLNSLGVFYWTQGKYREAVALCQRALAIWEQALGPEHPQVARCLHNLAMIYNEEGQSAEAVPLCQRALAIWEQALGPEHPYVGYGLHTLANLYQALGQSAEAVPLCQRALAIWEQALGPEHSDLASGLNTLAELYQALGQYAEAVPLCQRALAIREQVLGPEHPDVADSLNTLAELYQGQGHDGEALPLYERAVQINEQARPDHPDTATSLEHLAALLRQMGRAEQAGPLEARAQAIRTQRSQPA